MEIDLEHLLKEASAVQTRIPLDVGGSAGAVGAALITDKGNIYTGICVIVACGIGFCAEHSAIAEMLKHGEKNIHAVVAIEEGKVLPPCGRCRELMVNISSYNQQTMVAVSNNQLVQLKELIPHQWINYELYV
jgi:cytidine deaminase